MERIERGEGGVVDAVGVTDIDIEILMDDAEASFRKLQSDSARIVFDFYKLRAKLELLIEAYYGRVSQVSSKVQEMGGAPHSRSERPRLSKSEQLFDRPSRATEAPSETQAPKAKKEKK